MLHWFIRIITDSSARNCIQLSWGRRRVSDNQMARRAFPSMFVLRFPTWLIFMVVVWLLSILDEAWHNDGWQDQMRQDIENLWCTNFGGDVVLVTRRRTVKMNCLEWDDDTLLTGPFGSAWTLQDLFAREEGESFAST